MQLQYSNNEICIALCKRQPGNLYHRELNQLCAGLHLTKISKTELSLNDCQSLHAFIINEKVRLCLEKFGIEIERQFIPTKNLLACIHNKSTHNLNCAT